MENDNEILERFNIWLKNNFKLNIDEVEPSNVKGYWNIKKACGGLYGGCKHPLHRCIGGENPVHHTISYYDPLKGKNGKFQSIYKTWNAHKRKLNINL